MSLNQQNGSLHETTYDDDQISAAYERQRSDKSMATQSIRLSKQKKRDPSQPKKVMVCVTRQKTGEHLIRQGASMAKALGAELIVLHAVVQNEKVLGNPNESEALETLFRLANEYGAQMRMLRCDNALDGLANAALDNDVGLMILGASPQNAQSLSEQIKMRLPGVNFIVLAASHWVDQIA